MGFKISKHLVILHKTFNSYLKLSDIDKLVALC